MKERTKTSRDKNLDIVEELLRQENRPLRVRDLVRLADGQFCTKSKQPQNVVSRDLSMDIKLNPRTRFRRIEEGVYALKENND